MRDSLSKWLGLSLISFAVILLALIQGQPVVAQKRAAPAAETDVTPRSVRTHELHNVWRLSGRVLSGSEPEDDAGFAELVALGVKTIVSVDGIAPRVELAEKHGLRYVHIPIGYDGVPAEAARALTRVARDIPGTVYVHCHHGKHRGPAAAAVLCRADDGRPPAAAREILEKAGTGAEYPGLWRSVAEFRAPPQDAALPELTDRAAVESLAATMAKLDRLFERMKTNLNKPSDAAPSEPTPADDSVQLTELFVEAARLATDAELRQGLDSAGKIAKELSSSLADDASRKHTTTLVERLSQSCTACHERHRN